MGNLETESCFLNFHEIGASLRNIHKPRVHSLCLEPVQLALLYVWSWSEEPIQKNKPRLEVQRRYLIMKNENVVEIV